jgi:hypothetical protein
MLGVAVSLSVRIAAQFFPLFSRSPPSPIHCDLPIDRHKLVGAHILGRSQTVDAPIEWL